MKKTSLSLVLCLVLLAGLVLACGPQAAAPEPTAEEPALKIALLLTSPVTDAGWNATAYEGLKQAESELGAEVSMSESIPTSENEAVFRDYASRGYDLLIGQSFSFGEAAMAVAPDFPDSKFVITTGIWEADNVSSYNPLLDNWFVSGALAALMSESGKLGILGGVEQPAMIATANAIADGARYVRPDIDISIAYVGSWADPAKAKELALAQIASGVDDIDGSVSAGFVGVVDAVKEVQEQQDKTVYIVQDVALDPSVAPDQIIGAHVQNFDGMVMYYANAVKDGTFIGTTYRPGLDTGLIDLLPTDLVPEDIKAQIEQIKQDIIDGKITIEEKYE